MSSGVLYACGETRRLPSRDDVTIPFVELSPSYELTRKYEDFLVRYLGKGTPLSLGPVSSATK